MPETKLDEQRIRELLQKADDKWFAAHSGRYNYHEHLDFTAAYIARNYTHQRKRGRAVVSSSGP